GSGGREAAAPVWRVRRHPAVLHRLVPRFLEVAGRLDPQAHPGVASPVLELPAVLEPGVARVPLSPRPDGGRRLAARVDGAEELGHGDAAEPGGQTHEVGLGRLTPQADEVAGVDGRDELAGPGYDDLG